MIRRSQMEIQAERQVDTLHMIATRQKNPVRFLRDELVKAETFYARSGDPNELAFVKTLERSLNGDVDE